MDESFIPTWISDVSGVSEDVFRDFKFVPLEADIKLHEALLNGHEKEISQLRQTLIKALEQIASLKAEISRLTLAAEPPKEKPYPAGSWRWRSGAY